MLFNELYINITETTCKATIYYISKKAVWIWTLFWYITLKFKIFYTILRLSVHPLRVQTGRYDRNRVPKNERYCLCCNSGDIEDEFHFICICSCFVDLRKQYLKKHYYQRPSMFKFLELLSSHNKTVLYKVSKYIKEALEIRNTFINL